jgi:hypothetical protein
VDADEDPGGDWPIDPAVAFYGLWPRFADDEIAEEPAEAEAASGAAD